MSDKITKFNKKKVAILSLSFFLSLVAIVVIYALNSMAPFGDKSLLIMDLNEQYSAFYNSLYNINENSNFLFSWNKAMGTEMISLFSYYLSSPFTILFFFFKQVDLHYAIFFINALKVSTASVTMSLFLKNRFLKWEYSFIIFSIAYSLTSYVIDYSMCLMWLDGVIWLPIVLIGIDRLLNDKSPALLIFSFLMAVLSNYYTSYMVYIFAVIYFFYRIFIEDVISKDKIFKKIITCVISSVLVAGMSMILVLPSFLYLMEGRLDYSISSGELFNFEIQNLLPNFLIGYYDSITGSGTASVYFTLIVFAFFISFFINSNIKIKEKIGASVVVIFFILSFVLTPLIKFWHIFSYPSWFPARHAFVFCFFVIYIGAKSYYSDLKKEKIALSLILLVLIVIAAYCLFAQELEALIKINILFIAVYLLIILLIKNENIRIISLVIFVFIEVCVNGYYHVKGLDNQFRYFDLQTNYIEYYNQLNPVVQQMQIDDGFYRIEKDFERTKNDAMEFNYKGITHYSSAFKSSTNHTLSALGNPQSYFWNSYYGPNPILDALFSVEYKILKGDTASFHNEVYENNDITLYNNPYTIPLIAFANGTKDINLDADAFTNSERILKSVYNYEGDILNSFSLNLEEYTGEKISDFHFKSSEDIVLKYTAISEVSGDVYLNLTSYNRYTLYVNSNEIKRYSEHLANEGTIYIGQFNEGEIIYLDFYFHDEEINIHTPTITTVNKELLEDVVNKINSTTENLIISGTDIKADIIADTDGFLYTSIPYDAGWQIKVNGEEIQTQKFIDTFLAVPLDEGENKIEMSFSPIGFKIGALLSILFMLLTITYLKKYPT